MSSRTIALLLIVAAIAVAPLGLEAAKRQRPDVRIIERSYDSFGYISMPGVTIATRYPDTITVPSPVDARITDLDLVLVDFSHDAPKDIDVLLVAPNGRSALVMGDVGGELEVFGLTLTLDDDAAERLPRRDALQSGTFRPANYPDGEESGGVTTGGDGTSGSDGSSGGDDVPGGGGEPGGSGQPGGNGGTGSDEFPEPAPTRINGSSLAVFNGMEPTGDWQLFIRADGPAAGSLGGWELRITSKKKR